MAESFLYALKWQKHVMLSSIERNIVDSATPPIHVFWNVLNKIKKSENWPSSRVYVSASGKTISGVFATYQSAQDPLPVLGLPGDTWLSEDCIYIKNKDGLWTRWRMGNVQTCPYDGSRLLVWSRSVHFKYLALDSLKTERRRWDIEGALSGCVADVVLTALPQAAEALKKAYNSLLEEDCVILLKAHCMSLRRNVREKSSAITERQEIEMHRYRQPLDNYESKGTVTCPNGMVVFLPYSERREDEAESAHVLACRWLLSGEDATTTPVGAQGPIDQLPIVATLKCPPPLSPMNTWLGLRDELNTICSTGRVSLLADVASDGPLYAWDEISLSAVMRREPDGSIIRWQSALRDEKLAQERKAPETISGTIMDFLKASRNTKDSVNCLDIPTFGGEMPYVIRELATSSRALCSTASLTLEFSTAKPKKPDIAAVEPAEHASPLESIAGATSGTLSLQEASENVVDHPLRVSERKRAATQSTCKSKRTKTAKHLPPADGAYSTNQRNGSQEGVPSRPMKRGIDLIFAKFLTYVNAKGGPHSIEFDAIKTASWIIAASTGAMSQAHHDAGGFLTWIKCDIGGKIWGYVMPKADTKNIKSAMKAYHDLVNNNTEPLKLAEIAKPFQTLLRPGTLVIQPPGAIHLVYTVEPSIFTCGHFYVLDAMHLTEVCRACAAYSDQGGTNASHPGSVRLLSRVALSLVFDWKKSVLRKPFISLARMLLWAYLYAPGDIDPADPMFKYDRESQGELAAAQAVVEAILEHNDLFVDDIRPEPLHTFNWLSSIGEGTDWTDWRDPGTVRLEVPDMRQYFVEYEEMLKEKQAAETL